MRLMKRMMMLALLVAIVGPMFGCMAGVGYSPADMRRQVRRTDLYDKQMFMDDLALATLTHRPLRTTRWVLD